MKLKLNKKTVLVVGGFSDSSHSHSTGGLVYACTSIVESTLKQKYNFIKINSAPKNNNPRNIFKRIISGLRRLVIFVYYLLSRKVDTVLIFAVNGWSFKEKGWMAMIAKKFNKNVVFAPRAGAIRDEICESRKVEIFARKVFEASDTIICQSQLWKDFFSNYTSHLTRLEVIENWIDLSKYQVDNYKPFDKFTFVFLAWVIKEKGIFELIEAVDQLKQRAEEFELLICGGGKDLEETKSIVASLNLKNIHFKGWVHDMAKVEILKRSHILILPTYFEGFSNSLLEAMACKLPVITTPVGSTPDIIIDKLNGFICEKENSNKLRETMEYVLDNKSKLEDVADMAYKRVLSINVIKFAIPKFEEILS